MNENKLSSFAIAEKFGQIVKLWQKLDKQPRKFGTEEELFSSEIHLIEVIGDNTDLSVSDIAGLLGVTKGAISQTLKKLENKGFVVKTIDPENNSRILTQLTSKGKTAYYAHRHWHETMDGGFREYFTSLPDEKIQFLYEVLSVVEDFLKKRM
jgi:DNA-binding MarR family transcriptional regulator